MNERAGQDQNELEEACKRFATRPVKPRMKQMSVALVLVAPLCLLGAQSRETCPLGPFELVSPRQQQKAVWHQASAAAELVAPSAALTAAATSSRRRVAPIPVPPPGPQIPTVNFIDSDILSRMRQDGIQPTEISGDEEFLRRATLDLTGQIPDAAAVQTFLADSSSDKRTKMIDQLIASDAFVDRWTMWFGDLVQNVQVSDNSREYYQGRNVYYNWIKQSLKDNKPYDSMVRELLAGSGDSFAAGTPDYIVRQLQPNGPLQDTYDNLAAQSAEKFLGMPILCLSCHGGLGHLESVNQSLQTKTRTDFWGMAAFFSRTRAQRVADPNSANTFKYNVTDAATGSYSLNTTSGNKTPRAPIQGQSAAVTPAYMFTGEQPGASEPWRDAYGRMLTADRQFARAAVNYLWKEMFGVGLVEPPNSFDLLRLDPAKLPAGQTLQTPNPQLLEDLTSSFISGGYNVRTLLRTMAMSSIYQLSSRYTPGGWSEAWTPYYARHYPHRLDAEMLLDAVARATSVPVTFSVAGMGTLNRAMLLPDPTESRNSVYGRFLDEFGRGDRDTEPRTHDASMAQALSLMNDKTVITNRVLKATANSTVAKVLASTTDPASVVDQLYLATLSRRPSATEKQAAITYLKSGTLQQKTEDLQWVLLNSLEFLFD
ncbi:MAG: DUF1549 domain-containing protein [Acidobacteriota bacterium]